MRASLSDVHPIAFFTSLVRTIVEIRRPDTTFVRPGALRICFGPLSKTGQFQKSKQAIRG
jgi:hypothetical protein